MSDELALSTDLLIEQLRIAAKCDCHSCRLHAAAAERLRGLYYAESDSFAVDRIKRLEMTLIYVLQIGPERARVEMEDQMGKLGQIASDVQRDAISAARKRS